MTLRRAQLAFHSAVQATALARYRYDEISTKGRLHTVIVFEARQELALRYLERAEDAAQR